MRRYPEAHRHVELLAGSGKCSDCVDDAGIQRVWGLLAWNRGARIHRLVLTKWLPAAQLRANPGVRQRGPEL